MTLRSSVLLAVTVLAGCDHEVLVHQDEPATQSLYQELARSWVRWAMILPYSSSPIEDTTGELCDLGQELGPGPHVWMLAGTSGGAVERECDIPAHTALFFPLINRWVVPGYDPTDLPEDIPAFIEWVGEYFAYARSTTCSLTLELDGEPLLADLEELDEELYVAVTEPFEATLNDDNWASAYGKQGGDYPLVFTDGHYALLRPLSPGEHTLMLGGARCDEEGAVTWETSATYTLTVAGGGPGGGFGGFGPF
ncbi:MAG: hypothetical protein H6712_13725 [Myxococcales bacterium]|nr:hypothetical protein [Myxococcales bacterium]